MSVVGTGEWVLLSHLTGISKSEVTVLKDTEMRTWKLLFRFPVVPGAAARRLLQRVPPGAGRTELGCARSWLLLGPVRCHRRDEEDGADASLGFPGRFDPRQQRCRCKQSAVPWWKVVEKLKSSQ